MRAFFADIPFWVYLVAGLVLVALIITVAVILLLRRRAATPRVPDGIEDMPGRVHAAFTAAGPILHTRLVERVATWLAGPGQPAPATAKRLLVVGPAGSGKTALLRQLSRDTTFAPTAAATPDSPCNLFRLEGGIAVEVAGRVLSDDDGKGRGGEAFKAVLSELKKAFPERPVDAIVLTIPCGSVLPGAVKDKSADVAFQLRKRIDEALATLQMRVPVYLVVTECDALQSFVSFGREVGDARRQRILGWSADDNALRDASVDWVEEALSGVSDAITDEQARRFAGDTPVWDASGYFLFPSDLSMCRDALRWYVDPIFHDAAQGAPPQLRGIYFMGRAAHAPPPLPSASGAPLAAGATSGAPPVLFAWDLFARKILPESNLAQPSVAAEKSRMRVIRVLQVISVIIALLWGAVLAFEWTILEKQTASVSPFLYSLDGALLHATAALDGASALEARDEDSAATLGIGPTECAGLLDAMADINAESLRSLTVPTSYLSRIDARIDQAIVVGYNRIVFTSFRREIESSRPHPEALRYEDTVDVDNTIPLEQTAEFRHADEWLTRLETYNANVDRYNTLVRHSPNNPAGPADIKSIADLSESLLQYKPKQSFFSNARYYTEALNYPSRDIKVIDLSVPLKEAQIDADDVFAKLHERLYELDSGPVVPEDLKRLDAAVKALTLSAVTDPSGFNTSYTADQLVELQRGIKEMDAHIGREPLRWVPSDGVPDPKEKQDALYKRVKGLDKLLGPKVEEKVLKDRADRLTELQRKLRTAESPIAKSYLVPVLARKEGGDHVEMKLDPRILALKDPTDALLRQSYMSGPQEKDAPLDVHEDTRCDWDVDLLKAASKAIKEHETADQEGLFEKFPDDVRPTMRALARTRVKARTLDLVDKAAKRSPAGLQRQSDAVLRADVDNYAQASVPLREIVGALRRMHVDEGSAAQRVRDLTASQGSRILKSLTQTINAESLYFASFEFWKGDGTPVYRAFQVTDAGQLAEYVVQQRERAAALSRGFGEPVLAVLQSPEINEVHPNNAIALWDQIASALRDYESKKAGNSVTTLERLILVELPAVTDLDKCLALPKTTPRRQGDFFAVRRQGLYDSLRSRCRDISRGERRDWYDRIRFAFNRALADHFPFSKNTQTEGADPEAVRAVLKEVTDFRTRYRDILAFEATEQKNRDLSEIVRFLDKVEAARVFLLPLWAQGEAADGAYDVRTEFRANTARESGGNEIAEWSLRVAEDRIYLGGPKDKLRWHLDDPVRVTLRWAKNSPDMPSFAQAPGAVVQERSVIYDEQKSWALLRIMAAHQSPLRDGESRFEGSNLLLFRVRIIPDPGGGFIDRLGTDAGEARVFIRITLPGVEKDKLLKYPDFPTTAPAYFETLDKSTGKTAAF